MTPAETEARQALRCLYIAVEEHVAADVEKRCISAFESLKNGASPELPPVNRIPENIDEPRIVVECYHVGSWCPERDGKGPATQVHITFHLAGDIPPMAIRLKSKLAADQMIEALIRHRNDVWPTP
jgi:hypothetical protein